MVFLIKTIKNSLNLCLYIAMELIHENFLSIFSPNQTHHEGEQKEATGWIDF